MGPFLGLRRLTLEKTYSSHWSPVLSLHTRLTELLLEMLNCRLGAGNAKREQTHIHAHTHIHRFLMLAAIKCRLKSFFKNSDLVLKEVSNQVHSENRELSFVIFA